MGLWWGQYVGLYSLPKVFSCSPLTLALSRKGRGKFKERTFGNRYISNFDAEIVW
jgi:hypothetical protein